MGEHIVIFRHHTGRGVGPTVRVVVESVEAANPSEAHERALAVLKEVFDANSVTVDIRREERTRVFADTLAAAE